MAIYYPGKYYLISVDEKNDACCICPFDIESVEQSLGNVYTFNPDVFGSPVTKVTGQLYGKTRIISKPLKELDGISYEEIMNLIKE